ncbi:MAG: GTP cyclohydrolase I, partial [Bacteroidota bacterium]
MSFSHELNYDADITDRLSAIFEEVITGVGEDANREGLIKTPERAAKAMQYLTQGYQQDAEAIIRGAMFAEDYSEMVIVKDIEFYSLCEHHMLPFFGKAHIAYIPDGYIVGLSKLPRVVDVFARRLQVQERLTDQVLQAL